MSTGYRSFATAAGLMHNPELSPQNCDAGHVQFNINQVKKKNGFNQVILVPVDFSEVTENAMLHGLELARRLCCGMCLLHVFEKKTDTILNKEDGRLEKAQQELQGYKEKYGLEYQVVLDPLIREGALFKGISKTITEVRPHLMVMGTHGKQGLQHLFGSHALRVVLDAACTVIVVQNIPFSKGYQRIMLPVNSDADPSGLIEWVLVMSRLFNSEIHLFQSLELNEEQDKNIKKIIGQITGVLTERKISFMVSTAGLATDFSGQVLGYAEATAQDLIMTMTMPATDASGYSFSDWNERLMFNPARIPVMFVEHAGLPG